MRQLNSSLPDQLKEVPNLIIHSPHDLGRSIVAIGLHDREKEFLLTLVMAVKLPQKVQLTLEALADFLLAVRFIALCVGVQEPTHPDQGRSQGQIFILKDPHGMTRMVRFCQIYTSHRILEEIGMNIAEFHDILKGDARVRVHQFMLHQRNLDGRHPRKVCIKALLNGFRTGPMVQVQQNIA